MRISMRERLLDGRQSLHLAARTLAGRRYWIAPLLTLLWPAVLVVQANIAQGVEFLPADAQVLVMGLPMSVLALAFGARIIAGEIDKRTLEIVYTVPGGAHRVWLSKMAAATLLLIGAELMLALCALVLCGPFPAEALYGALQAAVAWLVIAMGWSTLTRSEAAGLLLSVVTMAVIGVMTGFNSTAGSRFSPFFNPANYPDRAVREILGWTVQNRIGIALALLGLTALTFTRAERREKLLS